MFGRSAPPAVTSRDPADRWTWDGKSALNGKSQSGSVGPQLQVGLIYGTFALSREGAQSLAFPGVRITSNICVLKGSQPLRTTGPLRFTPCTD